MRLRTSTARRSRYKLPEAKKARPRARPRAPRSRADDSAMQALEERYAREGSGPAGTARTTTPKPAPRVTPTTERLDVQTSKHLNAQRTEKASELSARPPKPPGPGIVWRDGRVLANGGRRGAGWLRRLTVYLPPELARRVDVSAATTGADKSTIIVEALHQWFEARENRR